jgi:DNA-binding NtrC family response regulator
MILTSKIYKMEIYGSLLASGKKMNNNDSQPPPGNHINEDIKIPSNFKILAIDDDVDFLEALEFTLKDVELEVVAVESGYHALEVLNEVYFDLILLDLKMPGMDGAETFKKIKAIDAQPFVIIMTAYFEDKKIEAVNKLNPFGFINKPFDLDDLMPYIKKRVKEKVNGN